MLIMLLIYQRKLHYNVQEYMPLEKESMIVMEVISKIHQFSSKKQEVYWKANILMYQDIGYLENNNNQLQEYAVRDKEFTLEMEQLKSINFSLLNK